MPATLHGLLTRACYYAVIDCRWLVRTELDPVWATRCTTLTRRHAGQILEVSNQPWIPAMSRSRSAVTVVLVQLLSLCGLVSLGTESSLGTV